MDPGYLILGTGLWFQDPAFRSLDLSSSVLVVLVFLGGEGD